MLRRIMRHDFQVLAAERILWIVALLLLALIALGIYNGASWARDRNISAAEAESKTLDGLAKLREEVIAFETGTKPLPTATPAALLPTGENVPAVLGPAPLAALSVGQSDLYPFSTIFSRNTSRTIRSIF